MAEESTTARSKKPANQQRALVVQEIGCYVMLLPRRSRGEREGTTQPKMIDVNNNKGFAVLTIFMPTNSWPMGITPSSRSREGVSSLLRSNLFLSALCPSRGLRDATHSSKVVFRLKSTSFIPPTTHTHTHFRRKKKGMHARRAK